MISLEHLAKKFPGQAEPAVQDLSMDIPEGEIVILVGPSGCGKSTTMRLINRLIEPTGGRIVLDGEDVTRVNSDELRRRIGYVIQQIGLFPHMTIAENIATVPRMLGWDRKRVAERVDELLETVNMDPDEYRRRYPKELSGGQQQRVGVARAMAADPPILLMDEPFGAIDPITRDRLQNEFLRVQSEIKKTIVFVTHDIDEAVKMGDRIAVLRQGSVIAQYDTPERILTNPADAYVETFIGSGAALKGLTLAYVRDVELADWAIVDSKAGRETMREALEHSGREAVLALDADRRPSRWYTARDLDRPESLDEVGLHATATVESNATLHDALDQMLTSLTGTVIVVDRDGGYRGVVELDAIRHHVDQVRAAAIERAKERTSVPASDTDDPSAVEMTR
ncbi:MAG: ABC transporter ATP-binding protein [Thermoleophilaceae bacterium]|nr:ABC transporter ATP-binding protein [Thermoleophilaceae bacterium]